MEPTKQDAFGSVLGRSPGRNPAQDWSELLNQPEEVWSVREAAVAFRVGPVLGRNTLRYGEAI